MCECKENNWVRIPVDTYPISDHAPGCSEFKAERFTKLIFEGSFCIMEPHEAAAVVADNDEGHEYQLQDVYLTRDQFDRLPDFAGF
jgi:hypothetical protein